MSFEANRVRHFKREIMQGIYVALWFLLLFSHGIQLSEAHHLHHFVVKEAVYTRLCSTKSILTVNGKFPGPTIYTRRGETVYVKVYNKSKYNITLHWHGVKQPRNPWSDGPEYITQCPIQPGARFIQKVIFSLEEGTLWWHAHSDWSRATVYGAIVIYPKRGTTYPFPWPNSDVLIQLGEWWNRDVNEVYREFLATGGTPNVSDAYTINGQPGDLYPCSRAGTFKLFAFHGQTILLRIINAAMNQILFFSISNHPITVVASDASYTKPLTRNYIAISPGQTIDVLLRANQTPNLYYMAARAYSSGAGVAYDNTTTTAILQYQNVGHDFSHPPTLPPLPYYNNTNAALDFTTILRGRTLRDYPYDLPFHVTTRIFSTVSVNTMPCQAGRTCEGPNGTRLRASMSNISFVLPRIDILEAYYYHVRGVFGKRFPNVPPLFFNFTAEYEPLILEIPRLSTEVKILEYNETVEMVLQGTNLVAGIDHPMHLHGQSFYVVGWGLGNFDPRYHPLTYNLVDPPFQNTAMVPKNGWIAIRFRANNPGVWFMHCHLERHLSWGMEMVFIVKDGKTRQARLLPPPRHMPPC